MIFLLLLATHLRNCVPFESSIFWRPRVFWMLKQVACRSDIERGKENEGKLPPHLWVLPPGFHTPSVRIFERDGTCSEIYGPLPDLILQMVPTAYIAVGIVSTLERWFTTRLMCRCHATLFIILIFLFIFYFLRQGFTQLCSPD